jgi:hypothetical protein
MGLEKGKRVEPWRMGNKYTEDSHGVQCDWQ